MTQVEESTGTPPTRQRSPLSGWLGVVALALGTFTVVTSEMLPVGLLTPMGESLRVSEGVAGLTLTITGLVAAVSSPVLVSMLGRTDRRMALCALVAVLVIGNLGAAWAPNFGIMVVARILVGIGMGGVWAIAAGLAVRLVPAKSVGPATSLVFSGIAVASVLGVPAGTYLGAAAGWRSAFLAAAGLGLVVLVAAAVLLPRLPAERAIPLGGVMGLFGNAQVRTGLIVVGFVVTGHFAAYTYIRPVLEDVSGVGAGMIGTLLLVYGVAGVAGNFLAGAGAARSPRKTLLVISAVMAATVIALPWLGGSVALAAVLMVVWGLSYGGVSVSTQTWILLASPGAREAASSLFVGVFNGAIALGALIGGLAADGIGITAVMWVGGALAVGALVTTTVGRSPTPAVGA
ncbi:MFS transporter [Streptomyces sp. ISL-112]|uniref:MFS transporter n=1 Tax=unclassified Streptomyces TaxID=2593676 RepID=UPI001BE5DB1E|nr:MULTISPECIES: MFS transporter [unclassified Streptomyces]MBT2428995.1 MFS transporter [Streptomyces sp. ISL-112]MBT2464107.1 MFS transporter [Streptomyces sp. ISL-63]